MAITLDEARGLAAGWAAAVRGRDDMVARCTEAGMTISELSRLTGIGRKTIYDVLGRLERTRQRRPVPPDTAAALASLADRLKGSLEAARPAGQGIAQFSGGPVPVTFRQPAVDCPECGHGMDLHYRISGQTGCTGAYGCRCSSGGDPA